MKKWIIGGVIAFVLLLVLGGGVAAAVLAGQRGDDNGGGLAVLMEPIEKGTLIRTVSAPGSVVPRTDVQISAQVSARIIGLPFKEGDIVQAGDPIVRLDARDLQAQLDAAQANLKSEQARLGGAQADLIEARAEYDRRKGLYETRDISKSELDRFEAAYLRADSTVKVIEHAIEVAQANIKRAERDLDNAVITSPISGVVTRINAEVGELVLVGTLNNAASVIMEVADLSDILVRARIDESNVADVEAGQKATIYLNAYSENDYRGTVEFVRLRRETGADGAAFVEAEIAVDNEGDGSLFSGLSANVDIEVQKYFDAMLVPSQAVVERRVEDLPRAVVKGNDIIDHNKTFTRAVFVVEDGVAKLRPVTTGPSDLTQTVLTGGVEEGETIVVGPFRNLLDMQHDQRVRDLDEELAETADANEDGETESGESDGGSEDAPADDDASADEDDDASASAGGE